MARTETAVSLEDVEDTRLNLENQGEGPHVREFDFLSEIPDLWDPCQEAAERAEADRIIAERASSADACSPGYSPPSGPAEASLLLIMRFGATASFRIVNLDSSRDVSKPACPSQFGALEG